MSITLVFNKSIFWQIIDFFLVFWNFYIKVSIFLLKVEYFWILWFCEKERKPRAKFVTQRWKTFVNTKSMPGDGGGVVLDFLRFSLLSTGTRWKGARGCELCFRDKNDERKASKQRAKRIRPFGIVHCSLFVSRSINVNGDRYVSATRVSFFVLFPALSRALSKGLKLTINHQFTNHHIRILTILPFRQNLICCFNVYFF